MIQLLHNFAIYIVLRDKRLIYNFNYKYKDFHLPDDILNCVKGILYKFH